MLTDNSAYFSQTFSRFLGRCTALTGPARDRLEELVQQLAAALLEGHSCLPLGDGDAELLRQSPLVSCGGGTPLVVFRGRLYLHRYFSYEKRLAGRLKQLAASPCVAALEAEAIDALFPPLQGEIDYQRQAAELCLRKSLAVVSGGPGTGKTTTVVKIICLLFQELGADIRIALAAPTGKAAMRLGEAVRNSLGALQVAAAIKNAVPEQAQTLHRLLGGNRASSRVTYHSGNPLPFEVIVVDEASMVDLALMSKLADAISPQGRLILLGDKDQLASVESGAVLTDLVRGLPDCQVILRRSFRFDSNIKMLAEAINGGDARHAWAILEDAKIPQLRRHDDDIVSSITGRFAKYLSQAQSCGGSPAAIRDLLQAFNSFRVLCAIHHGARGVQGINLAVEQGLARRGFGCRPGTWYGGRPVLITANDYPLDLFNGDVGICLEGSQGEFLVWFEKADGSLRGYPPFRLPRCETVYAMTIHKSQGSEFAEIMIVLPDEDNPVLSRELLYTGITRARKGITVASSAGIFERALTRTVNRHSGLLAMLQE